MINDQGVALCVEAKSGQVVWRERLKGKHSASAIYAQDRIYMFNEKGLATALQPGREFKILAENDLEERMMATPAVSGRSLIVRTRSQIYCLENKK
jgi:outer membrane protein assembly factor BamB